MGEKDLLSLLSQSKGTSWNRQGTGVGGGSSNFILATKSQIYFMLEKQTQKYSQQLSKAKNKINLCFPARLASHDAGEPHIPGMRFLAAYEFF